MTSGLNPSEERERLRAILEQLREALERAPAEDDDTKQRLEALARETSSLLEGEDEGWAQAHRSFGNRLSEEVAHFEGSHPDLAYVIARVIDALSGLGI